MTWSPPACRTAAACMSASSAVQHATLNLILLHCFEQRPEVSFAEPLVTLALDDLEKDRADDRRGEYLQQPPAARRGGPVDQDAALPQRLNILTMTGKPRVDRLVIGIRRRV